MSQADKMTADEVWPLGPRHTSPRALYETQALKTPGFRGGGGVPRPPEAVGRIRVARPPILQCPLPLAPPSAETKLQPVGVQCL